MPRERISRKVLEVTLFWRGRAAWEWQVHSGKDVHAYGVEASRMAARYAMYDALFTMLAAGWNG